jgi:hypothetical protein
MKNCFWFLIILLQFNFCIGQPPSKIELSESTLIGIANNGNPAFVCDKDELILVLNNIFTNDNYIDITIMQILVDGGLEYYLQLSKNGSNKKLVKWLHNKESKLFIEDVTSKKYERMGNYVSCEGEDECFPRLMMEKGQLIWSCRELAICVNKEMAEKHPCRYSNTRISK